MTVQERNNTTKIAWSLGIGATIGVIAMAVVVGIGYTFMGGITGKPELDTDKGVASFLSSLVRSWLFLFSMPLVYAWAGRLRASLVAKALVVVAASVLASFAVVSATSGDLGMGAWYLWVGILGYPVFIASRGRVALAVVLGLLGAICIGLAYGPGDSGVLAKFFDILVGGVGFTRIALSFAVLTVLTGMVSSLDPEEVQPGGTVGPGDRLCPDCHATVPASTTACPQCGRRLD